MKKLSMLIIFLMIALTVKAQGVRFSTQITQKTVIVAGIPNVVTVPTNPAVAFCAAPANAVPCTNKATTYTDSTLATPCSTSTQIVLDGTTTCVASPDAQNNFGVWVAPGQYTYTVTVNGANFGPFYVSVGGASIVNVSVPFSATPVFTYTAGSQETSFSMILTGNVTSSSMAGTFVAGADAQFVICQDTVGGRTFVWPANFINPPVVGTVAGNSTPCGVNNSGTAATFVYCGSAGTASCPANSWHNTDQGPAGVISSPITGPTGSIVVSTNCGIPAASNCYVVAADAKIVSDATWSNASSTITTGAGDPAFQSTGGIYPATCSTPSATCDIGKAVFATGNCAPANPYQCVGSIPQGTITAITSAHVATVSTTSTSASSSGSGLTFLAWCTDDSTPLQAAADAAYSSATPTTLLLPAGGMCFSKVLFNSTRVTRSNYAVSIRGSGLASTNLVPLPNFTCTAGQVCFLRLNYSAGQSSAALSWADNAQDFTFFGAGKDLPEGSNFTGTAHALISAQNVTSIKNVVVQGSFWNRASTNTDYGFECIGCYATNVISFVAGNFGSHLQGGLPGNNGLVQGSYFGSTAFTSCVIDGTNIVLTTIGMACATPIRSSGDTLSAAVNIPTGATVRWTDQHSDIEGGIFFSGGSSVLDSTVVRAVAGGLSAAMVVNNAAATVNFSNFHYTQPGFPWLSLSAGLANFECGNFGNFQGAGVATITGGTLNVMPCTVGGDTQLAKTSAQSAKTVFTVGGSTSLCRVHLSVQCTTSSAAATVTPSVLYTDTSNTAQTISGTAANCNALGAASNTSQDVTFRAKNATAIQYQTVIANTPTYDVSVNVEQLSLN